MKKTLIYSSLYLLCFFLDNFYWFLIKINSFLTFLLHLLLLAHLFLHSVVLGHSVWIYSNTNSIEVHLCALVRSENFKVSIFTPITTPWVLNNPEIGFTLSVPTNNLNYMLTIEFEWVISSVVKTVSVSQEISVDCHLSNNWSILKDFLFDSLIVSSKAIINNSVELIVNSAFISFEMFFITFSLRCIVWIALFWNETLSFTEIQYSVYISSFTVVVALIAANNFLSRKLNFSLWSLANSISSSWESCWCICARAITLVEDWLSAIWINLSPIVFFWNNWFFIILSLAGRNISSVWKRVLEKLFSIS